MGWGGSGPPRLEQRLPRMAPRSQRHESVTLNKRLAVVPGLEPVTQTVWITDRRSVTHRHMTAIPPIRTFFFPSRVFPGRRDTVDVVPSSK